MRPCGEALSAFSYRALEQLRARLEGKGTDDEDEIDRRLATAVAEIEKKDQFDLVLESGEREEDYRRLKEYYAQCSELTSPRPRPS